MSKIIIGMDAERGHDVKLDVKAFLRTHLLLWASTGGGKSYLIRRTKLILDKESLDLAIDKLKKGETK